MQTLTQRSDSLKERVRMALAEAGYPNARIYGTDDDPSVGLQQYGDPPDEVMWRAFRVATGGWTPCWPCYDQGYGDDCHGGDCRNA